MTHDDYQATGINHFSALEDLLKTRRDMLQTLINIIDTSGHKVTAYGALKAARLHFDKAVLDELQKIIDSHKAVGLLEKSTTEPTKPKMTDEQKELGKSFHNALVDLQSYVIPYIKRNGIGRYEEMAINAHICLAKNYLPSGRINSSTISPFVGVGDLPYHRFSRKVDTSPHGIAGAVLCGRV